MKSSQLLMWLGIIAGLAFVAIGYVYASRSAGHLPHWFPGYETGSSHVHTKHAIAAFLLAAGSWIFAWFQSGPKKLPEHQNN